LYFLEINNPRKVELSLNYDGLPLFKSSGAVFWPVLCCIRNLKKEVVFPLTICYGTSKPQNLQFLEPLISQLNYLILNGLEISGRKIEVKIHRYNN